MRFLLALLATFAPTMATAQSRDAAADAAALQDLNKFLNDPAARAGFAATNQNAAQVEAMFAKFPPYAQQELNAIVMLIMEESKEGAMKHVAQYKSGGAQAAYGSFSPRVKARVQALQSRLSGDRAFNSAANLQMMKSFIPAFLGAPGV